MGRIRIGKSVGKSASRNTTKPIHNLAHPAGIGAATNAHWRAFLRGINQRHLKQFPGDTQIAARISSYELATRMQLQGFL